jgi:general L-amino acid transport system substrate-binding protein
MAYRITRATLALLGAWLAISGITAGSVQAQKFENCAFRQGPEGPCTCTVAGSDAEPRIVAKSRCQQPPAKKSATEPRASTADGPASSSPARATAASSTRAAVEQRGRLVCGVNGGLPGFSWRDPSGAWSGFDVDFCKAVAAAVLGDAEKVEFVPLGTEDRFTALASGRIDVLARNTTWTLEREATLFVEYAGVSWYDGQGFMTKAETGFVTAQQLAGSSLCVLEGTTTEQNTNFFFRQLNSEARIVRLKDRAEMIAAYLGGKCDAYTADRSALFSDRSTFPDPDAHTILPEVISREPLGPVVRSGDVQWTRAVRWVLAGMINAEEEQLDQRALTIRRALPPGAQRLVEGAGRIGPAAGLRPTWLVDVVRQVGNYRELFEKNLGSGGKLKMERGLNALWRDGGILYAPPVW